MLFAATRPDQLILRACYSHPDLPSRLAFVGMLLQALRAQEAVGISSTNLFLGGIAQYEFKYLSSIEADTMTTAPTRELIQ